MTGGWLEREAIITVKAYPNPSSKYFETVCVAGITAEEKNIRLYPVNFRSLPEERRFKKYQRVRLLMKKHDKDRRPESYRPDENSIELLEEIGTGKFWRKRWDWVRPSIGPTMCELLKLQKETSQSLGCIKPADVSGFEVQDADPKWSPKKEEVINQMPLFDPVEKKLEKIPFVFRYKYRCESKACRGHSQSIIDWELMELYRKVRDRYVERHDILAKVRGKFLDQLCAPDRDTHFFVGNHSLFPQSFMVLGVFWPPKADEKQRSLF